MANQVLSHLLYHLDDMARKHGAAYLYDRCTEHGQSLRELALKSLDSFQLGDAVHKLTAKRRGSSAAEHSMPRRGSRT